jgi:hypothetical protein
MNRRRFEMSRFSRTALLLVLSATLVLIYYVYATVLNRPSADVYIAQRGTAISAVYGTVSIAWAYALPVYAQNTGYIHLAPGFGTTVTSLGLLVKKDQVMATIIDEAGQRSLNQARTDLEAAQGRLKLGPASQGSLQSVLDRFHAYDKLPKVNGYPQGVPRVEYEAARNDVNRLRAAVDNEKLELQRQVDLALGVVKGLEDQLKRADVRSPMDGVLIAQNFNDNTYVTLNAALFTVATRDTYVSGAVNEEDVGKLKEGMKAELRLYAYSNRTFNATVTAILPSPDPNSQRYTVTLAMDNPPDNLRAGLTGEMNILLGRKENALIIPARALLVDQVLLVEDGVVEQHTVKTGFKSLEFVEIIDGLRDGAQVIVSDQDAFASGQRVRPTKINQPKTEEPKKKK